MRDANEIMNRITHVYQICECTNHEGSHVKVHFSGNSCEFGQTSCTF